MSSVYDRIRNICQNLISIFIFHIQLIDIVKAYFFSVDCSRWHNEIVQETRDSAMSLKKDQKFIKRW